MAAIMSLAQKTTAAAHGALTHANPLSPDQLSALARRLAALRPATALEIGCGPGSFALELAEQGPVQVLAIDNNPDFLQRARQQAAARVLAGNVVWREQAASEVDDRGFDAVICIGSSHAFGPPREALQRCAALTRPGGWLLFAELVWTATPSVEFLAALGEDASTYWAATAAKDVLSETGFSLIHEESASTPDWQCYEEAVRAGRHLYADSLTDPDASAAVRARAEAWYALYTQHARAHWGFSAYLAQRST